MFLKQFYIHVVYIFKRNIDIHHNQQMYSVKTSYILMYKCHLLYTLCTSRLIVDHHR